MQVLQGRRGPQVQRRPARCSGSSAASADPDEPVGEPEPAGPGCRRAGRRPARWLTAGRHAAVGHVDEPGRDGSSNSSRAATAAAAAAAAAAGSSLRTRARDDRRDDRPRRARRPHARSRPELAQEQRVAAGRGERRRADLVRRRVTRPAAARQERDGGVRRRVRRTVSRSTSAPASRSGPTRCPARPGLAGAARRAARPGRGTRVAQQRPQQQQGRLVGPLHVVDDEQAAAVASSAPPAARRAGRTGRSPAVDGRPRARAAATARTAAPRRRRPGPSGPAPAGVGRRPGRGSSCRCPPRRRRRPGGAARPARARRPQQQGLPARPGSSSRARVPSGVHGR